MKKIISCLLFVLLLGLASCGSSPEKLDLTVESGRFICAPNDIVAYLNKQNKDTGYYTIPDFTSSGEKIPIYADGENTNIYLTFLTETDGKATDIELELYTAATEQDIESFMQYLTLLFNNITNNTDYTSNLMTAVTDLTSSRETERSFSMTKFNGVGVSGMSSPGFYTINIHAQNENDNNA